MHRRKFFAAILGSLFSVSGCLSQSSQNSEEKSRIQKILLQNKDSKRRKVHLEVKADGNTKLSNTYLLDSEGGKDISGNLLQDKNQSGYENITITAEIKETSEKRKLTISKTGCVSVIIEVMNGTPTMYEGEVPENTPC